MAFCKAIRLIQIVLFLSCSVSCALVTDMYEIQVRVVDEDGAPVKDADVYISFGKNTSSDSKMSSKNSVTGADGIFKVSGSGNGHISYGATKSGYYPSRYTYDFPGRADASLQKREFVVLLRKIGNPVPMYARKVTAILPATNKEIGFDLFRADWVAPYGAGSTADFNVSLEADDSGPDDFEYKVTIKFNGKMSGVYEVTDNILTGSSYKLPRLANDEGYQKSLNLMWRGLKRGQKRTWNQNKHYIYRVRAEEKDGRLLRAMYGKIVSDVRIVSNRREGKLPSVEFTYYLNPDYTRNLEFDTKHNLFGELPDLEKIRQP